MTEIQQYKLSLRRIRNYQRKLSQKREAFQPVTNEESTLTSIIDSLTYSIQYLETGREPGTRRGAHRRSREQREVLMDPQSYQFMLLTATKSNPVKQLSKNQLEHLDDLLDQLTPREKEAFTLVRGQGLTFEAARDAMGFKSRGSVQVLVESAETKLQFLVQKPPNGEGNFIQRVLTF